MPELRRPTIAPFAYICNIPDISGCLLVTFRLDNPWHVFPLTSVKSPHDTVASQEHPKLGVYVKGLYLMPCETKKDVMGSLATFGIIWQDWQSGAVWDKVGPLEEHQSQPFNPLAGNSQGIFSPNITTEEHVYQHLSRDVAM